MESHDFRVCRRVPRRVPNRARVLMHLRCNKLTQSVTIRVILAGMAGQGGLFTLNLGHLYLHAMISSANIVYYDSVISIHDP